MDVAILFGMVIAFLAIGAGSPTAGFGELQTL